MPKTKSKTRIRRIVEERGKIDKSLQYTADEAVKLLKETHSTKFDESVDLDIRLGVDPRASDQQVRGSIALPHGTGKSVRVAAFAQGEKAQEAQEAGADVVGAADLAAKIQGGFLDFDAAVATPDMMREVGKLGKVLGPRGMMPNPKSGTVTNDIGAAVRELKAGKVEYRVDRYGIVHNTVGKTSFSEDQLIDNVRALLDAILKARPAAAKGAYVRSATLTSTQGPGIRISPGA